MSIEDAPFFDHWLMGPVKGMGVFYSRGHLSSLWHWKEGCRTLQPSFGWLWYQVLEKIELASRSNRSLIGRTLARIEDR
jgi:hypothetical protein